MQDFMTADQAFEIETTQSFVELCAYLEVGLMSRVADSFGHLKMGA